MQEFDVAVVGAGLAGLEVARDLASRGRRVAIIDRKSNLADGVHTTGIFVRRTLESFDLPDDCLGPAVRHVTLYSPYGRSLNLESRFEEFRVGKMGYLYNTWLDRVRAAGVSVFLDTAFQSLNAASDDESLTTLNLMTGSDHWSLNSRFVIGADGATSRVASQLGLSENKEWIVGVEHVFTDVPMVGEPRFHVWLDPVLAPGYIAWLVHDGEEVHVGVGGYANRFHPREALDEFLVKMRKQFPLDKGQLVERRGGRIPVGGVLPQLINKRGLLLGDAAGAVSPLTAGGLDPCLRQSQAAAVVADAWLNSGDAEVLKAYDGGWMRKKFWIRNGLRRMLAMIRSRWLMECGFYLFNTWPGRWFAHRVFFSPGSFPDLPLERSASLQAAITSQ
ncbi:MAG: NAD(P)/FAD-dependent oxidoreductase [Planctomycetaceae bacterium]|nr:NAD(P)/FAD-dependent oxidoreductase [Planctomycetaceae bacterium]